MKITHVNGSGSILNSTDIDLLPNEESSFAECKERAHNRGLVTYNLPSTKIFQDLVTRVHMGRYDPQSSFAVMMQVKERLVTDRNQFAHFQIVVRYVNPRNKVELITRVITERLLTTDNEIQFLNDVNEDALCVVLAKEAAYRAMHIRKDTDTELNGNKKRDPFVMQNQTTLANDEVEFSTAESQRNLDTTIHFITRARKLLNTSR